MEHERASLLGVMHECCSPLSSLRNVAEIHSGMASYGICVLFLLMRQKLQCALRRHLFSVFIFIVTWPWEDHSTSLCIHSSIGIVTDHDNMFLKHSMQVGWLCSPINLSATSECEDGIRQIFLVTLVKVFWSCRAIIKNISKRLSSYSVMQ